MNPTIKNHVKSILPNFVEEHLYQKRRAKKQVSLDVNLLIIVLDACRYDTFRDVYNGEFPGGLSKACSTACWTVPSHESIARGMIPFSADRRPTEVFANEYMIGFPLPSQHPYSFGIAAMPYLSDNATTENKTVQYFDHWECVPDSQNAKEVLEKSKRHMTHGDFFGILNLGETHFPYDYYDENLDEFLEKVESGDTNLDQAREQQRQAARKLIEMIDEFRSKIPAGTQVVLTADHGELFGERGGYGHDPDGQAVLDTKLFEVPLLSWIVDE